MISKPILIIGSNGFIGQGLSKHLSELGHQVVSINSRLSVSDYYLSVNLLDSDACEILREYQFQYVFNCAGYVDHAGYFSGGSDVFDQHFTLVKNLVDHLNWDSIESFVQVGSSDEYGSQPAPQHEEMREQSISPYSCGKSLATHFLQMLARTEGLPIQIARLFLVYGPGQKANRFLPQLIKSCLQNDSVDVSSGEQMRDFLYIDDAVSGLIKCSQHQESIGEVFNIASGSPLRLRDVMDAVQKQVGKGSLCYGKRPYRKGENMALYADIGKAQQLLNWVPTVSLDDGIARTIEWYRELISQEQENICT